MIPLNSTDALFLHMENRKQTMHVAGLFLFEIPEDAPENFVGIMAERWRTYGSAHPPFNKRLTKKGRKFYWIEDDEFDLQNHFQHIALPKPGRIRELLSYVSMQHSAIMDRSVPLWQLHLIEGIEGNRFGIYLKLHHCLTDGVGAIKMFKKAFSADPLKRHTPPHVGH